MPWINGWFKIYYVDLSEKKWSIPDTFSAIVRVCGDPSARTTLHGVRGRTYGVIASFTFPGNAFSLRLARALNPSRLARVTWYTPVFTRYACEE